MSCGVGRRLGLDPELLWLCHRPATTAPIRPLAWEPPYAAGAARKKAKRPKKRKKKKNSIQKNAKEGKGKQNKNLNLPISVTININGLSTSLKRQKKAVPSYMPFTTGIKMSKVKIQKKI